jgi:translation elongation factor EF-G
MQEPVMAIRVRAKRHHTGAVVGTLRLRGVKVLEECVRGREFIVRASAPLRDVMGLPEELAAVTDGTAAYWIRLAHYAPMEESPTL